MWNMLFFLCNVRGPAKRLHFNQLSAIVCLSLGITVACVGLRYFGFVGAVCGFVFGVYVSGFMLTRGRFYR